MYRAYKIAEDLIGQMELSESILDKIQRNSYANEREEMSQELLQKLRTMIENSTLNNEGHLEADSIWDDWFPQVAADVFISHSSKDVDTAKKLSAWLYEKFGIESFIDSQIWGHSDKLLKEIDDQYCLNSSGDTYSYEKRNGSTAHVHMMLSYALTRMIDKTECVIFIDSENSVSAEDAADGTFSPWIFHELATIDTIELKPLRGLIKIANFSGQTLVEASNESFDLKVKYPIWGKRLKTLDEEMLVKWYEKHNSADYEHTLDLLYAITANKSRIAG